MDRMLYVELKEGELWDIKKECVRATRTPHRKSIGAAHQIQLYERTGNP